MVRYFFLLRVTFTHFPLVFKQLELFWEGEEAGSKNGNLSKLADPYTLYVKYLGQNNISVFHCHYVQGKFTGTHMP